MDDFKIKMMDDNPLKRKVKNYPEGRNYRPRPVPPQPGPEPGPHPGPEPGPSPAPESSMKSCWD